MCDEGPISAMLRDNPCRVRNAHLSPGLPTGFTWVYPGKPGFGFKLYFGKSGEYWVIKYFKCSEGQNCANLWILRQVRLLDNKEHMYIKSIHRDLLQYLLFYTL